ncbi:MAG TPA: hypothetical protein DD670_21340, partial [Planctomycetaceae bacterium]|nr:hypothetical protein [Planctomycetaceae bacterium]
MLDEFYVDNYKSLVNVTFCPKQQNLLLGTNNAGKTNLCQAMKFLSATASWSLDDCADRVAGLRFAIANHHFDKPTVDFRVRATIPFAGEELTFRYSLTIGIKKNNLMAPSLEVDEESLRVSGGGFPDAMLLANTAESVRLLHEVDYLAGRSNFVTTTAPRNATMLSRLYDLQTNERANLFK